MNHEHYVQAIQNAASLCQDVDLLELVLKILLESCD